MNGYVTAAAGLALLAGMAAPVTPAAAVQQANTVGQFDPTYGCVSCHADKRRAFSQGVHSERGIRCHDCHGGDPASFETATAHRGRFVGTPSKTATVELCAACHSDPDQMRQYGLPADQVAELRTSLHGELLLGQGNADAPTCTNCHDAHTILRPEDARSNIYPTNIPATCAACHQDQQLMDKYGLPTDQHEQFRESAHGVQLFEVQNFAAPTCVGCHGSHAALPPGVTEIVNVCTRCHVLVGQAFNAGPHGEAARAGDLPGCVACHSNHGTEIVPPDEIAEGCTNCHDQNGNASVLGLEIQERITQATTDLVAAEHAIEELVRNGREVSDARFRYQSALTDYLQLTQMQHGLDAEQLEDLSRQVGSVSRSIRETAEVSEEERWEHKLVLVPVWFLALSAMAFAWFKLRDLQR
jgi:hypothetical protein